MRQVTMTAQEALGSQHDILAKQRQSLCCTETPGGIRRRVVFVCTDCHKQWGQAWATLLDYECIASPGEYALRELEMRVRERCPHAQSFFASLGEFQ